MPGINELIPLQAGNINVNPSKGISQLADTIKFKQQQDRQDEDRAQNKEITDIQLQQARAQIKQAGKEQSMKDLAFDSVKAKALLDRGDVDGARNFTIDRINKLNERRKTDPTINTQETEQFLAALDTGDIEGARSMLDGEIQGLTQLGYLKESAKGETFTDITDEYGNVIAQKSSTGKVVDSPLAAKLLTPEEEAQKIRIAQSSKAETNINIGPNGETVTVVTPPALLEGLPPEVAKKVDAVFVAAGGGKDGIDAIDKVKSEFQEDERRAVSGKLIQESFPNATPAELKQLEATMDSAVTTESGLTKAKSVREEQRRLTKASGFQERAVTLLTKILDNEQLPDVLGSIEGSIDMRFSDAEAELIADIEEVSNILTADNLNLMTGVLSETDIKILANLASGGLNRKRSLKRFKGDAGEILSKLNSKKVETVNDTPVTVGRFKVKTR